MPWTETTHRRYKRSDDHRQNNLTDAEWAIIAPQLPKQGKMGRPRKTDLRSVFDAIQYILSTGCQWRALPGEYSTFSTVQNYFCGWRRSGVPGKILRRLRDRTRCSLCGAEHGRDRQPVGEDHGEWRSLWL